MISVTPQPSNTIPDIEAAANGNSERAQSPIIELSPILRNQHDERDLRQQILLIDGDKVGRVAILSFRALQLYRIAKLQAELIKEQNAAMNPSRRGTERSLTEQDIDGSIDNGVDTGKQIDELLQRYANAVRNYETLSQTITFGETTTYDFLGGKMEFKVKGRENRSSWYASKWVEPGQRATVPSDGIGPLGFRELDKKRLSERKFLDALKSRFHMALFGGVALITPMLIMSLHPGLAANLITSSVATIIFAIIVVVYGTDASGKDVLASTAAYAAVLVVFVGTSLQSLSRNGVIA